MKRITVSIADDVDLLLQREARRRETSVSEVVRATLELYFEPAAGSEPPFANLGVSGQIRISEDFEEILAAEWRPD